MYDTDNIFAKIIRKEVPSTILFEDDQLIAFQDQMPAAPTHILIVPKGEYISFDDFSQKASNEEIGHFFRIVQRIAKEAGVVESGYRLISNHGPYASQSVPHFHVHLLGGRNLGGLVSGDKFER